MPVLYRSSRTEATPRTLADAVLQGLAPDGGLYVPLNVPTLPQKWAKSTSFQALAWAMLEPWLDGLHGAEALVHDALNFDVPLVPLSGGAWNNVHVLELFHGPTLSFKDFGARTLARVMEGVRREGEALRILVATSGDTGSAVADGFAGREGVQVGLLYPAGQVSPVQERQLIAPRPGVTALRVDGTFDDCQRLVKGAFSDARFHDAHLSSANSINIGRLLPQMTYYGEAFRQGGFNEAVVVVPSGNLGNLTAGVMARMAGVPIRHFVAAHNANPFFPAYLAGSPAEMGRSIQTLSNAMDVGAPSNFERLNALLGSEMPGWIWGTNVDDPTTLNTMRRVYDETGYVACPHTAVGLEAVQRYRATHGYNGPMVVLATAHPAKFPEVVEQALGVAPDEPELLRALRDVPGAYTSIPATADALAQALGVGG